MKQKENFKSGGFLENSSYRHIRQLSILICVKETQSLRYGDNGFERKTMPIET